MTSNSSDRWKMPKRKIFLFNDKFNSYFSWDYPQSARACSCVYKRDTYLWPEQDTDSLMARSRWETICGSVSRIGSARLISILTPTYLFT